MLPQARKPAHCRLWSELLPAKVHPSVVLPPQPEFRSASPLLPAGPCRPLRRPSTERAKQRRCTLLASYCLDPLTSPSLRGSLLSSISRCSRRHRRVFAVGGPRSTPCGQVGTSSGPSLRDTTVSAPCPRTRSVLGLSAATNSAMPRPPDCTEPLPLACVEAPQCQARGIHGASPREMPELAVVLYGLLDDFAKDSFRRARACDGLTFCIWAAITNSKPHIKVGGQYPATLKIDRTINNTVNI